MSKNGNQEPQQNQMPSDIEVTPTESISDVYLAINPINNATKSENYPGTIEPPQPLGSPGTTGYINQDISPGPF